MVVLWREAPPPFRLRFVDVAPLVYGFLQVMSLRVVKDVVNASAAVSNLNPEP